MGGTGTGAVTPTLSTPVAASLVSGAIAAHVYTDVLTTPLSVWIGASGRAIVTISGSIDVNTNQVASLYVYINNTGNLVESDAQNTDTTLNFLINLTAVKLVEAIDSIVPNAINTFMVRSISSDVGSSLNFGSLIVQPL